MFSIFGNKLNCSLVILRVRKGGAHGARTRQKGDRKREMVQRVGKKEASVN